MPELETILWYIGLWFLAGLVLQEALGDPRTIEERLASLSQVMLTIGLVAWLLVSLWQGLTFNKDDATLKNSNV